MSSPNLYEETVKVATELYEKSGQVEGRDLENWIEAEKIVQATMNENNNDNSYEETVKIASEIYEKSGREEGRDLENWIKAERILKEGEQFCEMFRQMLVQNPLSASKLMEAIKLLLELEQKQELEILINSA